MKTNTTLAGALTLSALLLYLFTLAPTVLWGDSAKLAQFIFQFDLNIKPEYHPLHTIIGKIFSYIPYGNYATRINLMSAVFGALTVGMIGLITVELTGSYAASIAGALSLSVITETYTLFTFLLALQIWLLVLWDRRKSNRYLNGFAFTFGLSLSNSYLMPFFLPAFLFFFISSESRKSNRPSYTHLLLCLCLGASVCVVLASRSIMEGGGEIADMLSGGPFKRYYRSPVKIVREMAYYPFYLFYQFPVLGLPAGLAGAFGQWRSTRRIFLLLLIIFMTDLAFASGYMRQKQFFLLIASYIIYSIWIGIGLSLLYRKLDEEWHHAWHLITRIPARLVPAVSVAIICSLPSASYYTVPSLMKSLGKDAVGARSLPYRDGNRFFLLPDKHGEYGAEKYAMELFQIVEPHSIVIADFTPIAVLRYYQNVHGMRKDLTLKLVDFEPLDVAYIDRHIKDKKMYLADDLEPDYNIQELKKRYKVTPVGHIFRIDIVE